MSQKDRSTMLCSDLEMDLNAFVDNELEAIDSERVMIHLNNCPHC